MSYLFIIFVIKIYIIRAVYSETNSSCGDWETFIQRSKCLKLFDAYETYANASDLCKREKSGSTLLSIGSAEEQSLIEGYIYGELQSVDSLWIGAQRNNPLNRSQFKWDDGSALVYTNWDAVDLNANGSDCVEMQADVRRGKWIPVSCKKRLRVLCQYVIGGNEISVPLFTEIQAELRAFIEHTNREIDLLKQNPVPIGFIYVQLPSQSAPNSLWPTVQWEDISSAYQGLFFRVLGANSSAFGAIQEEDSPRLETVEQTHAWAPSGVSNPVTVPSNGNWSNLVLVSFDNSESVIDHYYLKFKVSKKEVRPRNQAIRVWKRIK